MISKSQPPLQLNPNNQARNPLQKSKSPTQGKFKRNEKPKVDTTSMTPYPILPSHHSVARHISPKGSANNVSFPSPTIPIPRLCSFTCMLGNTRLLDLVPGRHLYQGGHLRIGMGIGGDGSMGQKSNRCWRFGNLRNRHSLERMGAKHCGREDGVTPEVVEGIQLIANHHLPPKVHASSRESHRLSISPCNHYQCTSSRPKIPPLI